MTATAAEPAAPPCCPICGGTVFGPGPKGRTSPNGAMPRCAGCQSLERHRIFRIMFDRLGPKDFVRLAGDPVQPRPDRRSVLVRLARTCPSTASPAGSTSRRSTGRTPPTTSSSARMCWNMSATTAPPCTNCCASHGPTACSTLPSPIRSARTSRATGAFRNPRSTAIGVSMAPTWQNVSPPTSPISRCSPIADRIRSPANGRARSCCRARRPPSLDRRKAGQCRQPVFRAEAVAAAATTSAEKRNSRSGRTLAVVSA